MLSHSESMMEHNCPVHKAGECLVPFDTMDLRQERSPIMQHCLCPIISRPEEMDIGCEDILIKRFSNDVKSGIFHGKFDPVVLKQEQFDPSVLKQEQFDLYVPKQEQFDPGVLKQEQFDLSVLKQEQFYLCVLKQ